MISRTDVVLLLSSLNIPEQQVQDLIRQVYGSQDLPLEVLQFINDRRQLDLTAFYQKLRKSYNHKKSKLYVMLVRDDLNPAEIPTTLASYGLQVALYADKASDRQMFLNHARAREVNVVLAKYYTDYDLTGCLNLLRVIRADLIACEVIEGRRQS